MTKDERKRPKFYGLVIAPLLCFVSALVYAIAVIWWKPHIMFFVASVIPVFMGIGMIRSNVRHGWGWHGQRWSND